MRGRHAGDDTERDEQTVLGAEHELADAREPADPRRLAEGMLLDVPRCFGVGSVVVLRFAGLGRGAVSECHCLRLERLGWPVSRWVPE